ncbi:MAG: DsbA family oxidoreductase [Dehalococcoidia bacterium]
MNTIDSESAPISLLAFSDFVGPWCYIGLVEVERLQTAYDLDVQFAPFLLDPTTPPEGKARRQMTQPGDPPTAIEERASTLGISFTRGRTWSSNSHLALQAAVFSEERGDPLRFHRAMFKAYFEDLEEIGAIDTVVRIGTEAGLPEAELRAALTSGQYRAEVDEKIQWAYQVGVTAVPTFVLEEQYGIVGAQEGQVFRDVLLSKLGRAPR